MIRPTDSSSSKLYLQETVCGLVAYPAPMQQMDVTLDIVANCIWTRQELGCESLTVTVFHILQLFKSDTPDTGIGIVTLLSACD